MLCECFGLTENDVKARIRAGARTMEQIAGSCGAGSECGTCCEAIRTLLSQRLDSPQRSDTQSAAPSGGSSESSWRHAWKRLFASRRSRMAAAGR